MISRNSFYHKFCRLCLLLVTLICILSLESRATQTSRSIYPNGQGCFDPTNPTVHATWKGHKTMPVDEMRQLCVDISAYLGIHKENGANFLLEIAAAESDFGYYVRQVKGPAQSVWQIEPATARDMHERLPKRNPVMYKKIMALRDPNLDEEENVVTNLFYGGAMCVGVLYLKGIKFDTLTTLEIRAQAWKKYYNTYLGKGTLEGYCQKAMRYVGGKLDPNFKFQESFDPSLLRRLPNIFQQRDNERYLILPPDFDQSEIGRYYKRVLQEKPQVFEEVPRAVLKSKNVKIIMNSLTMELIRKIQQNPASIANYRDMPAEILQPLVMTAMHENALAAYPNLPAEYQARPDIQKLYESQKFLQRLLKRWCGWFWLYIWWV